MIDYNWEIVTNQANISEYPLQADGHILLYWDDMWMSPY